jgi:hypothetical protein
VWVPVSRFARPGMTKARKKGRLSKQAAQV